MDDAMSDQYMDNNYYFANEIMSEDGNEDQTSAERNNNENENNEEEEFRDEDDKISDKQQSTALLLSIFLGAVGGERWYLGLYRTAAFKMVLFLWIIGFPSIIIFTLQTNGCKDLLKSWIFPMIFGVFVFGLMAWIITDIALLALNEMNDSHGRMLQPM